MAGVGNNPSSWSLNNSAFTGWSFTDAVMYRANLVWDTNALAWVKETQPGGGGGGGAGGNFPTVKNSTDVGETLTIAAGFQFICAGYFNNFGDVVNLGEMVVL